MKKNKTNIPWVEKYRPKTIDDIVLNNSVFNNIKRVVDEKDMPNIIITGVPGVGKTTTILCLAKQLLGKYADQGVLELNASDERGIKTVQESIIYFCKKKLDIIDDPDRTYAKHKIILLDEADNMTVKAQQLINTLMETYHSTTRFAFTCNKSSDIIEAIQSRCLILRYVRLTNDNIISRLKQICSIENIKFTEEGLECLVVNAQGDLRKAINNLQLVFNGFGEINSDNVYKLCDKPHPTIIKNIFIACYNKDLKKALTQLDELRSSGYCGSDICISMTNTLKSTKIDEIDEETKIKYLEDISKTCIIISKGLDKPLQLTGCIAKLCLS